MKFENTQVYNIESALRGMRNPLESWSKSDTTKVMSVTNADGSHWVGIGENDMKLAHNLIKAGEPHRKFLRQIMLAVTITAPRYWWTEFDTYKVGVTRDSCSTMHKLTTTPITKDCFEHPELILTGLPETLEEIRQEYLQTKNNDLFLRLKANLPEGWLQTADVTMNYENLLNMIKWRKNHRLTEWSVDFIAWCHLLPYADELLFYTDVEKV